MLHTLMCPALGTTVPHSLYWHEPVIKCNCMLKLCPESGTIVVPLYLDKKGTKGEQLCLTCAIALKGSGTQVGYDNCIYHFW